MSFSQWFWKYGYFVVPLILAILWFFSSEKFLKRDDVNSEIFSYFKEIEQDCKSETFDKRSSNCAAIEKHKTECQKISAACDSKTYYDFLQKLGYKLPSYYLPGSNPG